MLNLLKLIVDQFFMQYLNAAVSSAESRNLIVDNTICVEATAVLEDVNTMKNATIEAETTAQAQHEANQKSLAQLQEEEIMRQAQDDPDPRGDGETADPSWTPGKGKGKRGRFDFPFLF